MVLIWVLVLVRRLAHSVFRSEPEFTTTSKNPSPVFSPAQTSTYTYLGVLRRSPTLPKWLEVLDHAALTRWRPGVRVPTSLPPNCCLFCGFARTIRYGRCDGL